MAPKPRVVLIIQARMGATRLPGKPLKKVLDKPLLSYLVERVRRCETVDTVVLATTTNPRDDALVDFCHANQLAYFRGSEEDVLSRYLEAAGQYKADVVVRTTGDCPLMDPHVIDDVVRYFLSQQPALDYATNCMPRTYPRGMDVEVFSRSSLEQVDQKATKSEEREHVTPYYYRHPELFKLGNVALKQDYSNHRWTVDEEDDFKLIATILENVYPNNPRFTLEDLLEEFNKHPDWIHINSHVKQKMV